MLAAALMVARREVGWHVSPVLTAQQITMDGPNSRVLFLPSQKVVTVTSVTEDDVLLDPATVRPSAGDGGFLRRRVALRKTSGDYWTDTYSGIELTIDHGFNEDEAADWRQAILSMVDQMSLLPVKASTGASGFGVKQERVDDVYTTYDTYAAMAEDVLFSVNHVLCGYKLPDLEFL